MNKLDSREEKIRALIDYYRDKGLLIVGLNDSVLHDLMGTKK